MKKLVLIAGLTAALSAPAFAGVNLVQDGEFSTSNVGTSWTTTITTPWTNLTDVNGIEIGYSPIYGLPTANATGTNLEVNAYTWGGVEQTVSGLVVGQVYDLSYLYGGRTSGGPDSLNVSFGGTLLTTDFGSAGVWTPNSFLVTATATSEVLEFASIPSDGSPSYGNEITNVSVTAVPETSTWVMMLAGFAGLGFAGYRRKKIATLAA